MILLIDNYDSFSYNLYQLIGKINPNVKVIHNDEMTVDEIKKLNLSHIIISPGPGRPENAGVIIDVIKELGPTIPTLGVCLGHQAIYHAFSGKIVYAKNIMHGKESQVRVDTFCPLFRKFPTSIQVARYHSLVADATSIPECLKVRAISADDNEIMALEHVKYPIYGVQFHPESIMTPKGSDLLANFLGVINYD